MAPWILKIVSSDHQTRSRKISSSSIILKNSSTNSSVIDSVMQRMDQLKDIGSRASSTLTSWFQVRLKVSNLIFEDKLFFRAWITASFWSAPLTDFGRSEIDPDFYDWFDIATLRNRSSMLNWVKAKSLAKHVINATKLQKVSRNLCYQKKFKWINLKLYEKLCQICCCQSPLSLIRHPREQPYVFAPRGMTSEGWLYMFLKTLRKSNQTKLESKRN